MSMQLSDLSDELQDTQIAIEGSISEVEQNLNTKIAMIEASHSLMLDSLSNMNTKIGNIQDSLSLIANSLKELSGDKEKLSNEFKEALASTEEQMGVALKEIHSSNIESFKEIKTIMQKDNSEELVGRIGNMFNKKADYIINETNKASNTLASGISILISKLKDRFVSQPVAVSTPSNVDTNTVVTETTPVESSNDEVVNEFQESINNLRKELGRELTSDEIEGLRTESFMTQAMSQMTGVARPKTQANVRGR